MFGPADRPLDARRRYFQDIVLAKDSTGIEPPLEGPTDQLAIFVSDASTRPGINPVDAYLHQRSPLRASASQIYQFVSHLCDATARFSREVLEVVVHIFIKKARARLRPLTVKSTVEGWLSQRPT
jgi:hypothetical protein